MVQWASVESTSRSLRGVHLLRQRTLETLRRELLDLLRDLGRTSSVTDALVVRGVNAFGQLALELGASEQHMRGGRTPSGAFSCTLPGTTEALGSVAWLV